MDAHTLGGTCILRTCPDDVDIDFLYIPYHYRYCLLLSISYSISTNRYDVDSNDELSLGEFDQFVRDQLCARFDDCLSKMSGRKRHNEGRATAEIGAHLEQHLTALQSQLQLAVKMREFDIAVELEENVRVVQVQKYA